MKTPPSSHFLDPDLDIAALQIARATSNTMVCPCVALDDSARDGRICLLCSNTRRLSPCPHCDGAGLTIQTHAAWRAKPDTCTWCGGRGVISLVASYLHGHKTRP